MRRGDGLPNGPVGMGVFVQGEKSGVVKPLVGGYVEDADGGLLNGLRGLSKGDECYG